MNPLLSFVYLLLVLIVIDGPLTLQGLSSVKSLYQFLSSPTSSVTSFPNPPLSVNSVWKGISPPRVQTFCLVVSYCKMNTMDVLQRQHSYMMFSLHICVLCLSVGELGSHIMLHYPFSAGIWNHILYHLPLYWVMPHSPVDLLWQWRALIRHLWGKKFWLAILHGVCWGIWMEHKKRIFKGVSRSLSLKSSTLLPLRLLLGLRLQKTSRASP